MKPAKFSYLTARSSSETATDLSNGSGRVKLIAGGQSLGPLLNLRLVRPDKLIDVSTLPELREVRQTADGFEIGAAVTHAEIEDDEFLDLAGSLTGRWLREAAANIAHRAVRNRGTLGGSLAHADPAADWVIVMTGINGVVLLDGPNGRRELSMDEFVTGPFETAVESGELISAVRINHPDTGSRWGYWKFVRQVGEFAKASATVLTGPTGGGARIAVGALGRQPLLLSDSDANDFVAGRVTAASILSEALPDRSAGDLALHVAALNNALEQALAEPNEAISS